MKAALWALALVLAFAGLWWGLVVSAIRDAAPGQAESLHEVRGDGRGIFLQAHGINPWLPSQHSLVRICPSDQERWIRERPFFFRLRDSQGLAFVTLAAGTDDRRLIFATDRYWDVAQVPSLSERIPFACVEEEDQAIERLLRLCVGYRNGAAYCKWPGVLGGGYNCNSFFAGLIQAAGLPRPTTMGGFWSFPGIGSPLPSSEFDLSTASFPEATS